MNSNVKGPIIFRHRSHFGLIAPFMSFCLECFPVSHVLYFLHFLFCFYWHAVTLWIYYLFMSFWLYCFSMSVWIRPSSRYLFFIYAFPFSSTVFPCSFSYIYFSHVLLLLLSSHFLLAISPLPCPSASPCGLYVSLESSVNTGWERRASYPTWRILYLEDLNPCENIVVYIPWSLWELDHPGLRLLVAGVWDVERISSLQCSRVSYIIIDKC